jgi:methyltransferase (TIGR00027 family)
MNEKKASFTAISTAYKRAYHSMYDSPKIFDDFLAYHLIPEEMQVQLKQHMTGKQLTDSKHMESCSELAGISSSISKATIVLSRAQYTEDMLEIAVRHGAGQYVILGAGLDTFAFRHTEMLKNLKVFEIDHPVTQEYKICRIAELGWNHPANLHFVPVDFTKDNLISALTRSSDYNPNVKTFFSWLGVSVYLTREEIFSTLNSITKIAPTGSSIIFDYLDSDAFISEKTNPEMQKKLETLRKMGEPMITGFNPSTLSEELKTSGFRLNENLSPENIDNDYFRGHTDVYHAQEYEYIAYATIE